ncbi:MAG: YceI family protein [Croceivirga sp.]
MYRLFLQLIFLASITLNAQYNEIKTAKITFDFPYKEVKGSIGGFTSTSTIDWNQPSESTLRGSVSVETLDTNNGIRNWSLRSGRYFNAKEYPTIIFESEEIKPNGGGWDVLGHLTIKGTKKEFQIHFTKMGNTLKGKGELYSSDFGVTIKKKREDNLVIVNFEFELGS